MHKVGLTAPLLVVVATKAGLTILARAVDNVTARERGIGQIMTCKHLPAFKRRAIK